MQVQKICMRLSFGVKNYEQTVFGKGVRLEMGINDGVLFGHET